MIFIVKEFVCVEHNIISVFLGTCVRSSNLPRVFSNSIIAGLGSSRLRYQHDLILWMRLKTEPRIANICSQAIQSGLPYQCFWFDIPDENIFSDSSNGLFTLTHNDARVRLIQFDPENGKKYFHFYHFTFIHVSTSPPPTKQKAKNRLLFYIFNRCHQLLQLFML